LHLLDQLEPVEALWLAQRWLRDLPTWREDCQAAGAFFATEGPEVSETVRELDLIRGENAMLGVEDDEENIGTIDEPIMHIPQLNKTEQIPVSRDQRQLWTEARRWAALVIYGI
jgi:hypothetical protein